jgi:hypothetical protein
MKSAVDNVKDVVDKTSERLFSGADVAATINL